MNRLNVQNSATHPINNTQLQILASQYEHLEAFFRGLNLPNNTCVLLGDTNTLPTPRRICFLKNRQTGNGILVRINTNNLTNSQLNSGSYKVNVNSQNFNVTNSLGTWNNIKKMTKTTQIFKKKIIIFYFIYYLCFRELLLIENQYFIAPCPKGSKTLIFNDIFLFSL